MTWSVLNRRRSSVCPQSKCCWHVWHFSIWPCPPDLYSSCCIVDPKSRPVADMHVLVVLYLCWNPTLFCPSLNSGFPRCVPILIQFSFLYVCQHLVVRSCHISFISWPVIVIARLLCYLHETASNRPKSFMMTPHLQTTFTEKE